MFHDDSNEAEGGCSAALSERDTRRSYQRGIQAPLGCAVAGIVERSLHTHAFSCPIRPSSERHRRVRVTGGGSRGRGGPGEEMRGEEDVLAAIRRYLAVTALVSLNS